MPTHEQHPDMSSHVQTCPVSCLKSPCLSVTDLWRHLRFLLCTPGVAQGSVLRAPPPHVDFHSAFTSLALVMISISALPANQQMTISGTYIFQALFPNHKRPSSASQDSLPIWTFLSLNHKSYSGQQLPWSQHQNRIVPSFKRSGALHFPPEPQLLQPLHPNAWVEFSVVLIFWSQPFRIIKIKNRDDRAISIISSPSRQAHSCLCTHETSLLKTSVNLSIMYEETWL